MNDIWYVTGKAVLDKSLDPAGTAGKGFYTPVVRTTSDQNPTTGVALPAPMVHNTGQIDEDAFPVVRKALPDFPEFAKPVSIGALARVIQYYQDPAVGAQLKTLRDAINAVQQPGDPLSDRFPVLLGACIIDASLRNQMAQNPLPEITKDFQTTSADHHFMQLLAADKAVSDAADDFADSNWNGGCEAVTSVWAGNSVFALR